jgi:D-amino-acid dehydrogenase
MTGPVVVVGAGIVGVSAAIWLQREGHEVVLIDRGEPGEGTSFGNGGVLASCSIVPVTVPGLLRKAPRMLFDPRQPLFLKWRHLARLAPWLRSYLSHCTHDETRRIADALFALTGESLADHQALAAGTGAEPFVVPCDYLYVYRDRSRFEADAFGWSIRREHGFRWDELDGMALRAHDPIFQPDLNFAVRLGGHGRITDPGRHVKVLGRHVEERGGRVIRAEVSNIVHQDGSVTGVRAGGETIPCSAAIITAGVWSGSLTKKLGLDVPLESERGYHIDLHEPNRMPRSPVMFASAKFVATPMEGRIRLAGIVEFGGLDAPPSRAPIDLLLRNIRAAMPDLTWSSAKEWMGHRPATPDSIPVIGAVPGIEGAWLGFGHHHIGLTAGPKTGRLLSQLVSGQRPNLDLAPYAPSRFIRRGQT